MARLTIYRDNYTDSTSVSNYFIDEYMKDANDAQIKVYLYLIRMLGANQAVSVSDLADKFNHTEKDVMRALKYWENRQLLALDYAGDGSLVGIHLRDLTREAETSARTPLTLVSPARMAQDVPTRMAQDVSSRMTQDVSSRMTQDIPSRVLQEAPSQTASAFTAPLQAVPAPQQVQAAEGRSYVKPSYSLDQLREFKNREETAQLLFIVESYIGKPLTPNEIKSILFITDELHFSDDLVDYLIQYCVERGKKDFKYIEKVAVNWAEEGITSPKQAQKTASRYDRNVYAIMNQLGKNSTPTTKELEYITRWTREYGFTNDIIFEACERTVLATDNHRFEYADSILSSWRKENVHHKSDILRIDEIYQQRRKNAARAASNKFNQFTQNNYDFDELERELLSN